jgi:hypothetical protein
MSKRFVLGENLPRNPHTREQKAVKRSESMSWKVVKLVGEHQLYKTFFPPNFCKPPCSFHGVRRTPTRTLAPVTTSLTSLREHLRKRNKNKKLERGERGGGKLKETSESVSRSYRTKNEIRKNKQTNTVYCTTRKSEFERFELRRYASKREDVRSCVVPVKAQLKLESETFASSPPIC